jgi:hypothetical protein
MFPLFSLLTTLYCDYPMHQYLTTEHRLPTRTSFSSHIACTYFRMTSLTYVPLISAFGRQRKEGLLSLFDHSFSEDNTTWFLLVIIESNFLWEEDTHRVNMKSPTSLCFKGHFLNLSMGSLDPERETCKFLISCNEYRKHYIGKKAKFEEYRASSPISCWPAQLHNCSLQIQPANFVECFNIRMLKSDVPGIRTQSNVRPQTTWP